MKELSDRPIRILITGSRPIVLFGLERLIQSSNNHFELIGTQTNPADALDLIRQFRPNLLLIEMDSDHQSGLEFIMRFRSLDADMRILVLFGEPNNLIHEKLVLAGANGVIDKLAPIDLILRAIEKVASGEIWLDRKSLTRLALRQKNDAKTDERDLKNRQLNQLTEREKEIISHLCLNTELKIKAIARNMAINEQTLRNHLTSIYDKLNVGSRLELYICAKTLGLN